MRLNLRLIGVLNGILLMGLVGRELLRLSSYAGGGGRDRERRNDGVMYLLLIGLAFMVLGFMGLFIGNLIKAAASRQREFLGRCLRSAIHAKSRWHWRRAQTNRLRNIRLDAGIAAHRRGEPHVLCRGN